VTILNEKQEEIDSGTGSYLEEVKFGTKQYWHIDENPCTFYEAEDEFLLPSDTKFRVDIGHILSKTWAEGDVIKDQYEQE